MKVVIVEIKGSDAAVLSEDGRFLKIKNRNYHIGQEIILRNNKYIKIAASVAASLILLATPAWAYLTPYSYVSLDINPSFEFSINRFDRVLSVKAINDDGAEVVEKISVDKLKNKEINEAVKNVLVGLKDQGYIIEGKESGVIVATSSKSQEKTDKLAASLKTSIEEEVKFNLENAYTEEKSVEKVEEIKDEMKKPEESVEGIKTEKTEDKDVKTEETKETEEDKKDKKDKKDKEDKVNKNDKKDKEDDQRAKNIKIEVIEVSNEEIYEAKEHNVTPGKMNLVRKLEEKVGKTFDEATFNEWLNKSVQEIMKETKKYEQEEKSEKKESKQQEKEDNKAKKEDKKEIKQEDRDKENKEKSNKEPEKKLNNKSNKNN